MKKIWIYCFLYGKKQVKQKSFLVLLLILPILVGFCAHLQRTTDTSIRIGLYISENTLQTLDSPMDSHGPTLPTVSDLIQRLTEETYHIGDAAILFYPCDTLSQLENDVAKGSAECGYVIPDSLYISLQQNEKNHLIQVVTSPTTTLSAVTNEMVYASLFREYARYTLQDYLWKESPLFADANGDISAADRTSFFQHVSDLYEKYLTNDSTFCFTYDTDSRTPDSTHALGSDTINPDVSTLDSTNFKPDNDHAPSILLSPVRGLIALFIMIAGFTGGYSYYHEKENHVYDNRTSHAVRRLQALSIFIPTFLISVMGLFCLLFSHGFTSLTQELPAMAYYDLIVVLFIWILMQLIPNKLLFVSFIPIFVLGSCVFTPIFIDITTYLPMLKPVQYLFLPYYYLISLS